MLEGLDKCKTTGDLFRAVNLYINKNNLKDKYSKNLQRQLKSNISFEKALQKVYDYILNSEYPFPKDKYAVVPPKLSSIHGMECSNSRR